MTGPSWTSAFIDLAPADVDRGASYWAAVTGYDAAAVADATREFPPLQPPTGDSYLWVQRVGDGPSRVHLDLHVPDVGRSVVHATEAGALLLDRREHAVLRSPSGLRFCLVADEGRAVPPPATWPGGHTSRVARAEVLVPHRTGGSEAELWNRIGPSHDHALAVRVSRSDAVAEPLVVLEVETSDRPAETARHEALGASVVRAGDDATVLRDPVGVVYRVV